VVGFPLPTAAHPVEVEDRIHVAIMAAFEVRNLEAAHLQAVPGKYRAVRCPHWSTCL
jgi:hypothetical protein